MKIDMVKDARFWNISHQRATKAHASLRIYMHIGIDATKSVFGVSDKARLKPVSAAAETSSKFKISLVANLDMILSKKRITKALISLREGAGWSALLLFANPDMLA